MIETSPEPTAYLKRTDVLKISKGWTKKLQRGFIIGRVKNTGRYAFLRERTIEGTPMYENCGYLDRGMAQVMFNCSTPECIKRFFHNVNNPDIAHKRLIDRIAAQKAVRKKEGSAFRNMGN